MRLQSIFLYWNSRPHREPVKSLLSDYAAMVAASQNQGELRLARVAGQSFDTRRHAAGRRHEPIFGRPVGYIGYYWF